MTDARGGHLAMLGAASEAITIGTLVVVGLNGLNGDSDANAVRAACELATRAITALTEFIERANAAIAN